MRIATWDVNPPRVRLPQRLASWTYRVFAFRRNHGLRIDRVLSCAACHIEREPAAPSARPITPR